MNKERLGCHSLKDQIPGYVGDLLVYQPFFAHLCQIWQPDN